VDCPSCDRSIPDDANLCPYCGASVVEPESKSEPPKKRKVPVWVFIVGAVVLLCGCLFVLTLVFPGDDSPAADSAQTPEPTPTPAVEETATPRHTATPAPPTATPSPEPTPTPALLTIFDIRQQKKELTDLQWDDYCRRLRGEEVRFSGKVLEVYSDGRVQINDDSEKGPVVILKQIPRETALEIGKDDRVEGIGTVEEVSVFLGIHVDIAVTGMRID